MGLRNRRGAVFGTAVVLAMVCSLVAYAVLIVALSQARQGRILHERPRARYAAEAGMVMLKERLWRDPTYCVSSREQIDTNGDGLGDTWLDLSVTNCGAGNRHEIMAKVVY